MSDKKLTDEEIIKRLERCVKRGNRNYDTDIVLDLIDRQKAEIEDLKENYTLDFEKMESEYDSNIKAEAYKEFAKRLKEYCGFNDYLSTYAWLSVKMDIDCVLKEMVGEEE